MLLEAAQFLATALPWPEPGWVGTPPFYVNIHWMLELDEKTEKGENKRIFPGRACTSVNEAINQIEYRLLAETKHGDGKRVGTDLYVSMSAMRAANAKIGRNNRPYFGAIRRHNNIERVKGLWADIDVKPDGYKTTQEAAEAFKAWRDKSGMPPPTFVIGSGSGGFHVHWSFSEAVEPLRWAQLAQRLYAAMQIEGLLADYGCTTDGTRLLRLPQTYNFKHVPPKPVTLWVTRAPFLIEYLEGILSKYSTTAPAQRAPRPGNAVSPLLGTMPAAARNPAVASADLSAGIEPNFVSIDDVYAVCPLVRDAFDSGGKVHRNPLWHAMAVLSVHLVDGQNVLHDLSDGHPDYDPVKIDELYERVKADHKRADSGWPTCFFLEQQAASSGLAHHCQQCPHRALGKSPLNFVQLKPPPPPLPPPLPPSASPIVVDRVKEFDVMPEGYERAADGTIHKEEEDPDGVLVKVRVSSIPIWNLYPVENPDKVMFTSFYGKRPREVTLSTFDFSSSDRLSAALGHAGVPEHRAYLPRLGGFFVSYIEELRKKGKEALLFDRMGWIYNEGGNPDGFAYNKRYNCAGDMPFSLSDGTMRKWYTPRGTIDPLLDITNAIFDQARGDLHFLYATAYGAPLMSFTGHSGAVVSSYSLQSGVGKTLMAKAGQAVWGHPTGAMTMLNATQLALDKKIGMVGNLPAYADEFMADPIQAVKRVLAQTSGKGRERLDRSGELKDSELWQTFLIVNGNRSLVEDINNDSDFQSEAVVMRIFEVCSDLPPGASVPMLGLDEKVEQLSNNFGRAGEIYAKFLGSNGLRVRTEVQRTISWVQTQTGAVAPERFWVATMACVLLGALYANETRLARFDTKALWRFMLSALSRLRTYRTSEALDLNNPEILIRYIEQFLQSNNRAVLHTTTMPTGQPGRQAVIDLLNLNDASHNNSGRWNARIGEQTKTIWINKPHFADWLKQRGIKQASIMTQMKNVLGAAMLRATMTAGLSASFSSTPTQVLEFNCTRAPLAKLLN